MNGGGINRESGKQFNVLVSPASNESAIVVANLAPNNNEVPGLGLSSRSGMDSNMSTPGGASPLSHPSPSDYAQDSAPKLMPFSGVYHLEEQRHNRGISESNSPSTPGKQQATYQNVLIHRNPAASPVSVPSFTGQRRMRGASLGVEVCNETHPLKTLGSKIEHDHFLRDEYHQPGNSVHRADPIGYNVEKWLEVLQPDPGSDSLSPPPSPYHQQQATYSQTNLIAGERAVDSPTTNSNRRASVVEIISSIGTLLNRDSLGSVESDTVRALSLVEMISSIDTLLDRDDSSHIDSETESMDGPPRKLLLVTPVLQVVNGDEVKNRTLLLFNDLLVIAKCITDMEGGIVMDNSFTVKNVLELKRCSGTIVSLGSPGLSGDRRSPFLQSFVSEFSKEQTSAVKRLCDTAGVGKDHSIFIANILFKTHELSRSRLGDFLGRRSSRDILHAFVDKFNFAGIRIDHALRIFLLSMLLSDEAEPFSLENLLTGFAVRWFAANGSMVVFDKECARKLVITIILLNASHHMRHAHSEAPATLQHFFDAVREYGYSIKKDLLEDIYEAVKHEKIHTPKEMPSDTRLAVTVSGATSPMHFIHRVKSDVVRVRIPAADPNLRIHLLGQGLLFEPPTLHFANSSEVIFRVTGTSLGTKAILYWRAGANAHLYSAMPLASEIVIERAFMRNTLRVEVKEPHPASDRESLGSELGSTYGANKEVYIFSMEDPREYDHWVKVLKARIDEANGILESKRPPTARRILAPGGVSMRIRRAAEMVAFEALKESLMGSESMSPL